MKELKKYKVKPNGWFDEGTEATLLNIITNNNCGLFEGIKNGRRDEEICPFDEFEEINAI